MEIQKEGKNVIVGTIYKSPDSSGSEFNDLLEQCLGKIGRENKPCYIVGDFNFDLLNYFRHSDTDSFIIMYSFSFFPLITKPTRVTTRSCSCIDNIFTNVVDKPILPGILYSDLSDHFPVFQLTSSMSPKYNGHLNSANRLRMEIYFNSLIDALSFKEWSSVTSKTNTDVAYNEFIDELTKLTKEHSKERSSQTKSRTPKHPVDHKRDS